MYFKIILSNFYIIRLKKNRKSPLYNFRSSLKNILIYFLLNHYLNAETTIMLIKSKPYLLNP